MYRVIRKNKEFKRQLLYGLITISGSIISAFIVAYFSSKSNIESVILASKSNEKISEKNIESQLNNTSEIIINNNKLLQETFKNNLEIIIKQNEINQKNQNEIYEKEKKIFINDSIKYFISDINSKISILEGYLAYIQIMQKSLKNETNDILLLRLNEKINEGLSIGLNKAFFELENEFIMNRLKSIDPNYASEILVFYKITAAISSLIENENNSKNDSKSEYLNEYLSMTADSEEIKNLIITLYKKIDKSANDYKIGAIYTIIDMGYKVIEHLLNSTGSDIKIIKSRHNSFTKEYSHLATMLNDPSKYTNDILNIYQKLKDNSENSTIAPEPRSRKIEKQITK